MENEFSRVNLICDGDYIIPRNPPGIDKYPVSVGPNQACTLFESTPGSDIVSGSSYLAAGYSLDIADIWRRNFLVIIGMFIFFQITQLIAIEYFQVRF